MSKKQQVHSTTQDFTEILDIEDDIVFFKNKTACAVLEVSSVNFFLLSAEEQNARIYGYMSLINSLSFSIQIVIISKRVDMQSYLKTLDQRLTTMQSTKLREHLGMYRQFIEELVKNEGLLDKKIYVVIPYSYLEGGAINASKNQKKPNVSTSYFSQQAKEGINTKRAMIMTQIERMGLSARPLAHEELIKLYYETLNNDTINIDFDSKDIKNVIV